MGRPSRNKEAEVSAAAKSVIEIARDENSARKRFRAISRFQKALFESIEELADDAYGALVARLVERKLGESRSNAQTYNALARLLQRGYLTKRTGHSAIEPGRSVTVYALTAEAKKALAQSR